MKFERIKNNKKKLIGVIAFLIIGVTIVIATSLAAYKTTKSVPIASGDVNYIIPDMKIVAIQIYDAGEWVSIDTIPSGDSYILDSESYCEYYDAESNEMVQTGNIKFQESNLTIEGLTHRNSKCYLKFIDLNTFTINDIVESVLADGVISERTDFAESFSEETTLQLFETEDNDGTTYYYAGNPTDNYLRFDGYDWRIIRINGDGSLRIMKEENIGLVYYEHDGSCDTCFEELGRWQFEDISDIVNATEYVVNSNFCSNAVDSETEDVIYEDIYGDSSDEFVNDYSAVIKKMRYYSGYNRWVNNTPSLVCDSYEALYGNITLDELMYAGMAGTFVAKKGLITETYSSEYVTQLYPSCTGGSYDSSGDGCTDYEYLDATMEKYNIDEDGYLSTSSVGLRYPVISLSPNIQLVGSGTQSDPYIVVGLSS